jgi:hypothetical protein
VGRDNPLSITPQGDDPITVKRAVPLGNWPQPYNQVRIAQPNPQVSIIQQPSVRRTSGFNALVVTCLIVIPGVIILASIANHGGQSVTGTGPSPSPTPVAFLNAVKKHDAETLARNTLADIQADYQKFLNDLFPHMNWIKVKYSGSGKRLHLYGYHDFFSHLTLTLGSEGPAISRWVSQNETRLKAAGIKQVGIYGLGYAPSGSYFTVD